MVDTEKSCGMGMRLDCTHTYMYVFTSAEMVATIGWPGHVVTGVPCGSQGVGMVGMGAGPGERMKKFKVLPFLVDCHAQVWGVAPGVQVDSNTRFVHVVGLRTTHN